MSTRSNIAIRLDDKDMNVELINVFGDTLVVRKRYLKIYCHWDGYPSGVGQDLISFSEDYEEVLGMIMEGDHSTVDTSYRGWRHEDWNDIQPSQQDTPTCEEQYLYVFEDGMWKIEYHGELVPLRAVLDGTYLSEDDCDRVADAAWEIAGTRADILIDDERFDDIEKILNNDQEILNKEIEEMIDDLKANTPDYSNFTAESLDKYFPDWRENFKEALIERVSDAYADYNTEENDK